MELPLTESLAWLLENARSLPRWAIVCLPALAPLSASDSCIVIDGRELDEDEDVPAAAVAANFSRPIGARTVVAVLDNLEQQLTSATQQVRLDALNYFLAADAFLEVSHHDA